MADNNEFSTNKITRKRQFKNYNQLRDYLSTLQNDISQGNIKASQIDFIPIFEACGDLLTEQTIDDAVITLKDSSLTFQEKIDEIRTYITRLNTGDELLSFAESHKNDDEKLASVLMKCWKQPLFLEQFPISYLAKSFTRWSGRNYTRTKRIFKEPDKVEKFIPKEIDFLEQSFELSVNKFYDFIKPKLPCNFTNLFTDPVEEINVYDGFLYMLHLIQQKKIEFNKTTGIFALMSTKAEKIYTEEKSK